MEVRQRVFIEHYQAAQREPTADEAIESWRPCRHAVLLVGVRPDSTPLFVELGSSIDLLDERGSHVIIVLAIVLK